MAIQYKPTKQKKEKPQKTPKVPKAEKPVKLGSAKAVKIEKPKKVKEPKAPKMPKPEKAIAFKPGKVEKAENLSKGNVLKKSVNPKIAVIVVVALIIVAVVAALVIIPAIKRHGEEIKGIEIVQLPKKTVYLEGEEADYDGLRIKVVHNNGEFYYVRETECEIIGFDSGKPYEKLYITVNYYGFSESFPIEIKENEKPKPVLESIRLDPMPKTVYGPGEWLNTDDSYIVCEYYDGSEVRLNLLNTHVFGWDKVNGPGTYTLTVRYAENGVLCTFDYDITVTE